MCVLRRAIAHSFIRALFSLANASLRAVFIGDSRATLYVINASEIRFRLSSTSPAYSMQVANGRPKVVQKSSQAAQMHRWARLRKRLRPVSASSTAYRFRSVTTSA
uniref:Putative secreted protein n=1 Tax=Anopheles triannulatus TaxID=58253 RepID=A0A2M4B735_9DIPT